jgi:hypothetical protein
MSAPTELELVRTKDDRRLYTLGDLGTLRLEGLFAWNATAATGSATWHIRRGILSRKIEAADDRGELVGEFHGRLLGSGGTLRWGNREFTVRRSSVLRERYALAESKDELALFDVKAWGRRPVLVRVDVSALDPGLLLFAVFVVRAAAADNTTAATSVAATSGAVAGGM